MKVLVSDGIEEIGAKILQDAGIEVVNKKVSPEELIQTIKEYDAIIVRSATKVTKEVIDAGNLKAIARGGVGLDNIDVAYAKEKSIPVLNTPGASSISVAELAIAHMFAVARFLNLSNTEMRNGKWPKKEYAHGFELTGKTLGIIGFGNIGKEVAKRALGLGMKVIVRKSSSPNDTNLDVTFVSQDELLSNSDIITLHIPLIKSQGPTISKNEFDKMKDGVVLINVARGGVVVENDLLNALNSGKVRAAGIDVFENEPFTEAQHNLINHHKVSVTPHIGASTDEAQERVGIEIAEKVIAVLKGK